MSLKRDIDYEMIENNAPEYADFYCIRLLNGKYSDIIYTYGIVKVGEKENDDGTMSLKFDWALVEKPESMKEDLNNSIEFQNHIGDILRDIIIDSVDEQPKHTNNYNQEVNSE
jgi:hypothetical protein|tara:strand:- start:64 stop:402 length:339 start_codon:yes stop_codon:yes gene_type:complete